VLDSIIRWALTHRLLTLALALAVLAGGLSAVRTLPVDVLPDLDRPRVTVFLEAPGMAPEEVEALVTRPFETALNGATGVESVRSTSAVGLGMVFVEFGYGTDLFRARQTVAEKLQTTQGQLPEGIAPVLGPVSSIMGQIMLIGMSGGHAPPDSVRAAAATAATPPAELRALADYAVRQRLLSIPGVAQVIPIGGDSRQYHVLADVPRLRSVGLSLTQLTDALRRSNRNTTGNFFERHGSEVLIRNVGRLRTVADIKAVIVGYRAGAPVTVGEVAQVRLGARYKRGDAGVSGQPGVILSIEKQPTASTIDLTHAVEVALADLQPSLPPDVRFDTHLFRQADFIEHALQNVEEALRDGAVLVVLVLFIFCSIGAPPSSRSPPFPSRSS
jgi:Cu/Ag efflux pump CusA